MIIPIESVSEEALEGLLKEYCLRAWGLNDTEFPLDESMSYAKAALMKGELVLWFSEYEESAYLLAAKDLPSADEQSAEYGDNW